MVSSTFCFLGVVCMSRSGHADDEARLAALKKQAKDLGIDSAVSFEMYAPSPFLCRHTLQACFCFYAGQ
eukprot:COSAG02_NODE_2492_length_8691_cov_45.293412_7_plen_69_part_00